MLKKGTSLKATSQMMNHGGIAITADVYAEFEQNDLPDEVWYNGNDEG